MVPSSVIAAAPLLVVLTAVTLSVSPSTSVSLSNTLMTMAVSSAVEAVSFVATGGSFTAVTVTSTVPVSVPPFPSDTT